MQLEHSFLDALAGQAAVIDCEGTILVTNSVWRSYAESKDCRSSGQAPSFDVGHNYLTACDGARVESNGVPGPLAQGIRDVMESKVEEFHHEYLCYSSDRTRWFKCFVRPLEPAGDGTGTFLVQHVEVTDQVGQRLSAESHLQSHQQRFANLINAVPARIANLSSDLVYQFVNPAFAEGVGLPIDEIEGRTIQQVLGENAWSNLRPYIERALNGETVSFETDLDLQDRKRLQVIAYYIPDRDPKGRITGMFAFIQDVTELKRRQHDLYLAMQAAEHANQAKSQFLASMSHELRTPLNAIMGFAEMIRMQITGGSNPQKQHEYAGDVLTSAQHLLSMVDDILDLSAIEGGKMTIDKQAVDLIEIFAECERSVRQQVERKGLALNISVPEAPPQLHADERAVRQVLLNILSNAIKYTPETGNIAADIREIDGFVVIQIADTGIGIAKERLERVTEAFSRAGHEPYIADKGWGLGLSISKALIELHSGTMRIASELGQGTTVTITLPSGSSSPQRVSVAS